ncbi:hypothetical protein OB03_01685 [Brevundimonas sp. GN22]
MKIHKLLLMPAMALFVLAASMEAQAQDSLEYVQADQAISDVAANGAEQISNPKPEEQASDDHTPIAGPETDQSQPSETIATPRESALEREMNRFSDNESGPAPIQTDKEPSSNSTTSMVVGGFILALIVVLIIAISTTKALADYSASRFGWPMIMNWWNALHLVSIFALVGAASLGSPMAGAVIAAGLWLIVLLVNIRKTNLLVGLTMTILQPFIVLIAWVIYGALKSKADGRRL